MSARQGRLRSTEDNGRAVGAADPVSVSRCVLCLLVGVVGVVVHRPASSVRIGGEAVLDQEAHEAQRGAVRSKCSQGY